MAIAIRSLTVLFIGLLAGSAWGQSPPSAADVLEALRGGGYVIVLRHGATHADQADTDPLNLENVARQRQLNDKGRADAKAHRRAVQVCRRADREVLLEPLQPRGRDRAAGRRQGARDHARPERGRSGGEPEREQPPDSGLPRPRRDRAGPGHQHPRWSRTSRTSSTPSARTGSRSRRARPRSSSPRAAASTRRSRACRWGSGPRSRSSPTRPDPTTSRAGSGGGSSRPSPPAAPRGSVAAGLEERVGGGRLLERAAAVEHHHRGGGDLAEAPVELGDRDRERARQMAGPVLRGAGGGRSPPPAGASRSATGDSRAR